jgi:DNA polymerase-1
VAAWLSGDQVALGEINGGQDTHSLNQSLFKLPDRLTAKIYLFRTIFRGSGWAFANDSDFTHVSDDPDYWDNINYQFYKKYYGLDKWHNELARKVAQREPIVSPLGMEWLILPLESGKLHWPTFTNYPVQGTANSLVAIARVSLKRRMTGLRSGLVGTVHDSIIADSPDDEVTQVVKLMKDVFDDIPKNVKKLWNITLPCAFPCEIKVGKNMKDMEKA